MDLKTMQRYREQLASLVVGATILQPAADAPNYWGETIAALAWALKLADAAIAQQQIAETPDPLPKPTSWNKES